MDDRPTSGDRHQRHCREAHIGNIAWLAVAVNIALVVGFGSLAWTAPKHAQATG